MNTLLAVILLLKGLEKLSFVNVSDPTSTYNQEENEGKKGKE